MAVECPQCGCRHCPANGSQTQTIQYRGRPRKFQRRWRVCRHCGTGFWSREFIEDQTPAPSTTGDVNPLYTREFLAPATPPAADAPPQNPYL